MRRWLRGGIGIALIAAVAIYVAFPHPTHDQAKLRAIAVESRLLLITYADRPGAIAKGHWPPAVAALHPVNVVVQNGTLNITTKPYLDGGWGYGFARDKRDLGMLAACWSSLGQDMYWHGPC